MIKPTTLISLFKLTSIIVKGKIILAGIYVPCPPPAKIIVTRRHKTVMINIFPSIFIYVRDIKLNNTSL